MAVENEPGAVNNEPGAVENEPRAAESVASAAAAVEVAPVAHVWAVGGISKVLGSKQLDVEVAVVEEVNLLFLVTALARLPERWDVRTRCCVGAPMSKEIARVQPMHVVKYHAWKV